MRKDRLREEARLIEERIAWAKEGLGEVNDRLGEVFLENEPLASQPDRLLALRFPGRPLGPESGHEHLYEEEPQRR